MAGDALGVGLPDRFEVQDVGGALTISWPWPKLLAVPTAAFAVVWNSFLIAFYRQMLQGDPPLAVLIFPVVHVAVGVFLVYFVLVLLLNRSTVQAGRGEITVRNGPLPWPGSRTLPASELDQLFCVARPGHRGIVVYHLMARLRSGREVKLVSALPEDRQARYLEQAVEEHLRIEDQPVTGELPR